MAGKPDQLMILMQGAQGSGKSTTAAILMDVLRHVVPVFTVSADYFFMGYGEYRFNAVNLPNAHEWCRRIAIKHMDAGESVIVDNCNATQKHAQPYIDMAKAAGATVVVVRRTGRYQNIHGVPEETVERVRQSLEELSV